LDIERWHPTKQIVTKRLGRNIITTLHGTNTSKTKERCSDDDAGDNDIDIPDEVIEAPNDNDYHKRNLCFHSPTSLVNCQKTSWISWAMMLNHVIQTSHFHGIPLAFL
jgi:hypothetical protein